MKRGPVPPKEVRYPSSDGQPMAENTWQLRAIIESVQMLGDHFRERRDVFVAGDLLIYFEEGDIDKSVAPDVFVVLGAPDHDRMFYKLWEEPKVPDFALEVASESTWREDQGRKRDLYASLGIGEYWLFDPRAEYFDLPLQGLRLEANGYRPIPARVGTGGRTLRSAALGLDIYVQNGRLRFRDVETNTVLPTYSEQREAMERERAARQSAEKRIAQLEARLAADPPEDPP